MEKKNQLDTYMAESYSFFSAFVAVTRSNSANENSRFSRTQLQLLLTWNPIEYPIDFWLSFDFRIFYVWKIVQNE